MSKKITDKEREAYKLLTKFVKRRDTGVWEMNHTYRRVSREEGRREGKKAKRLVNVPSKSAINEIAEMFNIPKSEINYNIDAKGFVDMFREGMKKLEAEEIEKKKEEKSKRQEELVKMKHKIEERFKTPSLSEHKFLIDEFKRRIVEEGIKQGQYMFSVDDIKEWIDKLDPKIDEILSTRDIVSIVEEIKNKGSKDWIKSYRKKKELAKNAQVIRDTVELSPEQEEELRNIENEYNDRKERDKNKRYLLPQQQHPTTSSRRRKQGLNENLFRGAYRKL